MIEEDRRQQPITKTEMSGDIILAYYPELAKRQKETSRRPMLDIEQIRAELEKNPQNQVDLLRKMLSKINRDEVLSTTRTKDFIMIKLGELTHEEIGYNPNSVSVEPLD